MKVVIANAKGGVGKTTTAMYLAQATHNDRMKTQVWDADVQASATLWADKARELGQPLPFDVVPVNQATLMRDTDWDELVFVDTPPAGEVMLKALQVADAVLVPMSDTTMDYQQTWITMHNIPATTPAFIMLTRVETNTRAYKNLIDALDEQHLPRLSTVIRKRQELKLAVGTKPDDLFEYLFLKNEFLRRVRQWALEGHHDNA